MDKAIHLNNKETTMMGLCICTANIRDKKIVCIHESLTPEVIGYLYPAQGPVQHPVSRIFLAVKQWIVSKLNLK